MKAENEEIQDATKKTERYRLHTWCSHKFYKIKIAFSMCQHCEVVESGSVWECDICALLLCEDSVREYHEEDMVHEEGDNKIEAEDGVESEADLEVDSEADLEVDSEADSEVKSEAADSEDDDESESESDSEFESDSSSENDESDYDSDSEEDDTEEVSIQNFPNHRGFTNVDCKQVNEVKQVQPRPRLFSLDSNHKVAVLMTLNVILTLIMVLLIVLLRGYRQDDLIDILDCIIPRSWTQKLFRPEVKRRDYVGRRHLAYHGYY